MCFKIPAHTRHKARSITRSRAQKSYWYCSWWRPLRGPGARGVREVVCKRGWPVSRICACVLLSSVSAVYWIAAQRIGLRLWLVQPSLLSCKTFQTHGTESSSACPALVSGWCLVTSGVRHVSQPIYSKPGKILHKPPLHCVLYYALWTIDSKWQLILIVSIVSICLWKRDDFV